jgi:hypothetical protein
MTRICFKGEISAVPLFPSLFLLLLLPLSLSLSLSLSSFFKNIKDKSNISLYPFLSVLLSLSLSVYLSLSLSPPLSPLFLSLTIPPTLLR